MPFYDQQKNSYKFNIVLNIERSVQYIIDLYIFEATYIQMRNKVETRIWSYLKREILKLFSKQRFSYYYNYYSGVDIVLYVKWCIWTFTIKKYIYT